MTWAESRHLTYWTPPQAPHKKAFLSKYWEAAGRQSHLKGSQNLRNLWSIPMLEAWGKHSRRMGGKKLGESRLPSPSAKLMCVFLSCSRASTLNEGVEHHQCSSTKWTLWYPLVLFSPSCGENIPFSYLNLKKKNVTTRGQKTLHFKVPKVIFQPLTPSP